MPTTATPAAAAKLIGGQSTAALAASLLVLEDIERRTPEQSMTRRWIIEAIEERHDVNAAMNAWAGDVSGDLTYVEALIAALPAEALS